MNKIYIPRFFGKHHIINLGAFDMKEEAQLVLWQYATTAHPLVKFEWAQNDFQLLDVNRTLNDGDVVGDVEKHTLNDKRKLQIQAEMLLLQRVRDLEERLAKLGHPVGENEWKSPV